MCISRICNKDCVLDKWTTDMINRPFKKTMLKWPSTVIIKEMQMKIKIIPLCARENTNTKHRRMPITGIGKDLEQLKTPRVATGKLNG